MSRVVVHGAAGRMGAEVCRTVDASAAHDLVAAVDPAAAGRRLGEVVAGLTPSGAELVVAATLDEVRDGAPEVLVDFTRFDVALAALRWSAQHGCHAVSGTTGIAPQDIDGLRELFAPAGTSNCILAANFAISAVLLVRLAELAAVHFDGVEIIELHHDGKRDAPSGTALETARRIAAARRSAGLVARPDPTTDEILPGARGGTGAGDIHIHAVRLPGLVAHEEVIFGALGQSLTIRQDSYDRTSFMPGVLAAIDRVASLDGLTVGLDAVLRL